MSVNEEHFNSRGSESWRIRTSEVTNCLPIVTISETNSPELLSRTCLKARLPAEQGGPICLAPTCIQREPYHRMKGMIRLVRFMYSRYSFPSLATNSFSS